MNKVSIDLSPVSAKAVLSAVTLIGITQLALKSNLSKATAFRFAGAGYRVRARMLYNTLGIRWKRLRVITDKSLSCPHLPLSLWFGRGNPTNPYLKGIIVAERRTKPKQLKLCPIENLWSEGESDNLEYTQYHCWMRQWLEWLRWYCTVPLGYDPSFEDLFDPPIISTSWKRTLFDPKVYKYGLLFRLWDLGDGWSLGTTPPCLEQRSWALLEDEK